MAVPQWLLDDPRVVATQRRPARPGRPADWPAWLPDDIRSSVAAAGIAAPWSHQVELAEAAHAGEHVAISTATASGKTLGYLLPILAATASSTPDPGARAVPSNTGLFTPRHTALYLAPTKALAHDQYRAARGLGPAGWRVGTLDGDSEDAERRFAREHASYVLTNPDMLHRSILPAHQRHRSLLAGLRYVVIDEAHRYRGVFGAHVSLVLRRLRRICQQYGADPVFVLASATASDVSQSGGLLVGEPQLRVVDQDGSPAPARTTLLWQPTQGERPGSVNSDATELFARLVDQGRQTITFVSSRAQSERIALNTAERLTGPGKVASYRAGYLAADRRALEGALQRGELTGVAATNALELGVDVAGMDAVLVAGFPGTLSALWQQLGRAGRADREALGVVIAREDPREAYLCAHPELVFEAPVERTVLHPLNPRVLGPHLAAAAQEAWLTEQDTRWFGDRLPELADALAAQGVLRRRPQGWFWTRPDRAVDFIDLRAMGGAAIQIIEDGTGRVVGQVDPGAADRTVHPGAVYLHQGEQWLVDDYRPDEGIALVRRDTPYYWTQPLAQSQVRVLRVEHERAFGDTGAMVRVGDVELSGQVTGYLRRDEQTNDVWDSTPLDLPERSFTSRSMWWTVPDAVVAGLGLNAVELGSALHAAEHCAIGLLPMFAPCDRWDIGGLSTALHPDTGLATIFIHDGHPGGAGFAERGFETAEAWLGATAERLRSCPCSDGCPSCVVSPKCGNANQMLDKAAALRLVEALLSGCPSSTAAC